MVAGGEEAWRGAEHHKPWPLLVKDFVEDTTFHGLRFLTLPGGRSLIRR